MPPSPSPAESPSGTSTNGKSTRCTATTAAGLPCKNWAVHGSDPPRCPSHGGGPGIVGPPKGNKNALKHGFYVQTREIRTIEDVIEDLAARQAALSGYIDFVVSSVERGELSTLTLDEMVTLLRLHGQNASRLGRLLRDQRALSGEAADGISGAIAQALDELSTELGVEL